MFLEWCLNLAARFECLCNSLTVRYVKTFSSFLRITKTKSIFYISYDYDGRFWCYMVSIFRFQHKTHTESKTNAFQYSKRQLATPTKTTSCYDCKIIIEMKKLNFRSHSKIAIEFLLTSENLSAKEIYPYLSEVLSYSIKTSMFGHLVLLLCMTDIYLVTICLNIQSVSSTLEESI